MKHSEEGVQKRKDKVIRWLKNPYNFSFACIMIFAIVARLYYFSITKDQPLWWDESDYMAYAKNLAGFSTHWIITAQHNSIFPWIVSVFFKLGISDIIIKFLFELVPSLLVIYLTYLICKEFYKDKKIALISMFLMACFWEFLFNSMRFHLEQLGLLLGYLAIYIFIKSYEKNEKIFGKIDKKWAMIITAILVTLTYTLRRGFFLFGFFIFFYLLFTKKIKDIAKDKYNWFALTIGILIIFFVETKIFASPITKVASAYYGAASFNLIPLTIFKSYFENIFNPTFNILLYLFWFGFIVITANLFLHFGYFKKSENIELRGDLLAFLMIIITLCYFLFYQKMNSLGDVRWYYPLLIGSFICISRGSLLISNFVKKYSKFVAILILIALIGYGGYYEMKHGDFIIRDKVNSFKGIKEAALFLKAISSQDAITISVPEPQPDYYAEREFIAPQDWLHKPADNITLDEFLDALRENKSIKYIIVTFSEPNHPSWMRQETYAQNPQTGQTMYAKWMIPFMNTTIDFTTGKQDIKQTMKYDNLTFNLLTIKEDAFVYEIVHG